MSSSGTLRPAASAVAGGAAARVAGFLALAGAAALAVLFADRFRVLYAGWSTDDNYSHGFLVPVVSGWLAWGVYQRQRLAAEGSLLIGLFWIVMGCVLHLWADVIWWTPVEFVALTTLLYGMAVLVGGRRWAQGFLFPILFLGFMFPLPSVLLNQAALWLQGVVTSAATGLLQLFVPAYHQGNIIKLPGAELEVGEQCSGLRQILAFVFLALVIAYMSKRRACQIGIVLAALPVAVAANLVRVLLMALLLMQFGPDTISEQTTVAFGVSYHTAWGLLTFTVGLGMLLGVAWWLGRVFPNRSEVTSSGQAREEAATPGPGLYSGLNRRLAAAVAVLVLANVLQVGLEGHLAAAGDLAARGVYLKKPLAAEGNKGFPVSLGAWSGREATPDPATLPYYNAADDRLNRDYVCDDVGCHLFMVHFRNGKDREHNPRICYEVIGCVENPAGHQDVQMEGSAASAQRFCFARRDESRYLSYVYYWHYTFEPDVAGLSWLQRLHAEWAVRPSLTVEVFTTARTPEQLDKAAEFVRLVDQELQAHLPPGARRGSEILPITARR
jgi:exosortase